MMVTNNDDDGIDVIHPTPPLLPGGSGNNAPTPNTLMPVIGIHQNFPASEHVNSLAPIRVRAGTKKQ